MTTALDTNILVALWRGTGAVTQAVQASMERAQRKGILIIAPPVYAEVIAAPHSDPDMVDTFLNRTRIEIDWDLDPTVWRAAALAFRGYAQRRRAQPGDPGPRRIRADFLIGAHALHAEASLMTLDQRLYHVAFPALSLIVPAE